MDGERCAIVLQSVSLPGCVIILTDHVIFLTDQTMNFTLPDGSTEPASVEAGSLGCGDGNVHLPENTAKEAESGYDHTSSRDVEAAQPAALT